MGYEEQENEEEITPSLTSRPACHHASRVFPTPRTVGSAGAPAAPAASSADYGMEVTVAAPLTFEGYTFSGWTTEDAVVSEGKFTMPDNDVAFTGSWKKNSDPEPNPQPEPNPNPNPEPGNDEQSKVKLKAVSKKKIKVSWKKLSKKVRKEVKQIQIQVSTDPDFQNIVKTKLVSSKKTSYTIGGLKKKTKYYIRIRAYTEKDGIKYVSEWVKKSKKTKKK